MAPPLSVIMIAKYRSVVGGGALVALKSYKHNGAPSLSLGLLSIAASEEGGAGLPTLTHLTCYSRTHAIDKFTHAFKRNHTHTHAFYKIEHNLLFLIIVTFVRLSVTLLIVFLLQNHSL